MDTSVSIQSQRTPVVDGTDNAPPSARYVWYVIGLLTLVNVVNYMDRMALSVLLPLIKTDLAISDAHLGLLTGFAFFIFYAIVGIPIAQWADRGNRAHIIATSLFLWSVMTALSGAAQRSWHLFVARMGVGAGEAGGLPAAQALICDYVPLERRSGVFAIHTFGLYAGMTVGMALAGYFAETIGWRWAFVVLGLPGIIAALVVKLTLREPMRGLADRESRAVGLQEEHDEAPPLRRAIVVLWRCDSYRWMLHYSVLSGFVEYGLNQWRPMFYVRTFGMSLAAVGSYLGIALGVGYGVGLLIGGLVANRVAERDVRKPLTISATATLMALPAAAGSLFVPSVAGSISLVFVSALLLSVSNGPVVANSLSVVAPRMRAISGALGTFAAAVVGFSLGPFCVGALSDLFSNSFGAHALQYAMLVPICVIPVMAITLYRAARALPDDLEAIRTLETGHRSPA